MQHSDMKPLKNLYKSAIKKTICDVPYDYKLPTLFNWITLQLIRNFDRFSDILTITLDHYLLQNVPITNNTF